MHTSVKKYTVCDDKDFPLEGRITEYYQLFQFGKFERLHRAPTEFPQSIILKNGTLTPYLRLKNCLCGHWWKRGIQR
ncbi:MAG: hypothetical protein WBL02_06410, partial [Methanomethylovorans sp.]|uniref:hypothetical protein n=1 Tax=Methanomethylovorans sp. TaxID=2758717 RepID=UPI003C736E79